MPLALIGFARHNPRDSIAGAISGDPMRRYRCAAAKRVMQNAGFPR
jgi:hypothetical protein